MTRCVLYVRVSTTQQVEQGHSLEAQADRLRQYAAFKDMTVVDLVTDSGLSGGRVDRPGYVRVLDLVRTKQVDAVCVVSLSRFARNTRATLDAIELFNRNGVALHSLSEQLDTTTPVGRFFCTTLAALATLEREQVGERTKAVLQYKRSQGERVGNLPFGYHLCDGGRLEPDEHEQEVIGLVRQLRDQGMTYAAIADELQRRQVTNRNGNTKWWTNQVHRIANLQTV